MKKSIFIILFLFLSLLLINNIYAFDSETIPVCGGDKETIIVCPVGDSENAPVPIIPKVSPQGVAGGGALPENVSNVSIPPKKAVSGKIDWLLIILIVLVIFFWWFIFFCKRKKKEKDKDSLCYRVDKKEEKE